MSSQLDDVARAAELLNSGSGTPKQRLIIGSKIFWAAMTRREVWPPELLEKAQLIYATLLKRGKVRTTVERMDDETASRCAEQFAKSVTELAAAIKQATGEGRTAE